MNVQRPALAYVPAEFRQKEHSFYPSDNTTPFEEYFYNNFDGDENTSDRLYLPVFWTSYHKNNNYGQSEPAKMRLQHFIDAVDRSRKYYTIVQYDDGCLVDFKDLDVKVFSMAGKPMHYTLPLISMPHAPSFPNDKRNIYCSFVGRLTHPIRERVVQSCSKIRHDTKEYYISLYNHNMIDYCRVLASSVFSLCPRGYSFNSFRIQESLQYGAIPVIISDEWHSPHGLDINEFCVIIPEEDIFFMDGILNAFTPEQIKEKQDRIPAVYEKYFTFAENKSLIIKTLNDGLV